MLRISAVKIHRVGYGGLWGLEIQSGCSFSFTFSLFLLESGVKCGGDGHSLLTLKDWICKLP